VLQGLREVEQKVAERASVAQHAIGGQPTAISVTSDTIQARNLLRKKKKKKVEAGPFWERTWFLVSCLAAVLAFIVWGFWPAGEERLFQQAHALMESEQATDWSRAYDGPVAELRRRFPEGKHVAEVQQYADKWEMHITEERLKNQQRLGQDPANEGARLYTQARQYELFGDLITAQEKYKGMVELLKDQGDMRPYLNLARRQLGQIESLPAGHLDRRKMVDDALERAESAYKSGKTLEARKIWNSIITLYETNRELEPQLQHARARLAGKEPGAARGESEK